MKLLRLALYNYSYRRSQVVLTFFCLVTAFLLFGILMSVRAAFVAAPEVASSYRLRTQSALSLASFLPKSYADKISQVSEVRYVVYATATAAAYQDDPQHLLLQAVSPDHFFDTFPELLVAKDQRTAFGADKTSIIAGPAIIKRYGWRLGQDISLQTNVVKPDGQGTWVFHLTGTYSSNDSSIPSDLVFINYNYLNDGRMTGKDEVLNFIEVIQDPSNAAKVSEKIDKQLSMYGSQVVTQPENTAIQNQLSQFGDFNLLTLIVAFSVFLSMFLLVHNVWYERVEMRLGEFAVMKALGFQEHSIILMVITEATLLTLVGAELALVIAECVVEGVRAGVNHILPTFHFPRSIYLSGTITAIIFGILSGIIPAWRAAKIHIASNLRS